MKRTFRERLFLATMGAVSGWFSFRLFKADENIEPEVTRISAVADLSHTVTINGVVESDSPHQAQCSGAFAVQSRITFYTKDAARGETTWSDSPFFVMQRSDFRINDGSGTIVAPSNIWVAGMSMVSVQKAFHTLPAAIQSSLLASFGSRAPDALSDKLIRMDEVFLPVGARVYALCDVKARGVVTVREVSTQPLGDRGYHTVQTIALTVLLAAGAVALVAMALYP
jgi:hypothetical protein